MNRNIIKGAKALAEFLGVHPNTISRWRREGRLDAATIVDTGRTIIFDLDLLPSCIKPQIPAICQPRPVRLKPA